MRLNNRAGHLNFSTFHENREYYVNQKKKWWWNTRHSVGGGGEGDFAA